MCIFTRKGDKMSDQSREVEFFALSTCGWCRKTKAWLDDHGIDYEITYMDQLSGDEKQAAKDRLLQFVSRLTFPVLIIDNGEEVIQGYKPERFEEVLG